MVLVKSFVGMDGVILSFEGDCLFLEKANLWLKVFGVIEL
jgi:hypothetical protein